MPSQEDIDGQISLLRVYRRTLTVYLEQRAALGSAYTPPGVAHGIVESRAQIRLIKKILREWNIQVEDIPVDEEQAELPLEQPTPPTLPTTDSSSSEEQIEEIQHLRKVLREKQRRLHILEERAALYGISTPPEVSIEIIDLREDVERLAKDIHDQEETLKSGSESQKSTAKQSQPVRRLNAFLCHSSKDKPAVRELYNRLTISGIQPWLDEEDILPGQDWELEISKAVRSCDVFIICLSNNSVNRAGYVNKEIKYALDIVGIQPEGIIFIIPLKLEACEVPDSLRKWQWLNYYEDQEKSYRHLIKALQVRADDLGLNINSP